MAASKTIFSNSAKTIADMQVIFAAMPMFSGSTHSMMEVRIQEMAAMLDFKMADKSAASDSVFGSSANIITDTKVIFAAIPRLYGAWYRMMGARSSTNGGHVGFQDGRPVGSVRLYCQY